MKDGLVLYCIPAYLYTIQLGDLPLDQNRPPRLTHTLRHTQSPTTKVFSKTKVSYAKISLNLEKLEAKHLMKKEFFSLNTVEPNVVFHLHFYKRKCVR